MGSPMPRAYHEPDAEPAPGSPGIGFSDGVGSGAGGVGVVSGILDQSTGGGGGASVAPAASEEPGSLLPGSADGSSESPLHAASVTARARTSRTPACP